MKKILLCLAVISCIVATILGTRSTSIAQQAMYGQCGGTPWTGQTTCISGATCVYMNEFYSQCLPSTTPGITCPPQECTAGGCGSSQCSIKSPDQPIGGGAEKSVTAQNGYFACCYKTEWGGNLYANSYSNACCH